MGGIYQGGYGRVPGGYLPICLHTTLGGTLTTLYTSLLHLPGYTCGPLPLLVVQCCEYTEPGSGERRPWALS